MSPFKQIMSTVGVILLCGILSIITVGMMEGSASVVCEECNGHGHIEHEDGEGIETHSCGICGGEGYTSGQYDSSLYQLVFFMIYVLAIGIVTGKLQRFTVKIGPLFMMKQGGNTSIIRKKKTKQKEKEE